MLSLIHIYVGAIDGGVVKDKANSAILQRRRVNAAKGSVDGAASQGKIHSAVIHFDPALHACQSEVLDHNGLGSAHLYSWRESFRRHRESAAFDRQAFVYIKRFREGSITLENNRAA